jgi:SAM-dependent methyltransferase
MRMGGLHAAIGRLHGRMVHQRRVRVLTDALLRLLPSHGSILDVGCGDGLLSSCIARCIPDAEIRGVDVLVRPDAHIPVARFDGDNLPLADRSVDTVMLVDVVHHAKNPEAFLREVGRVARHSIVIKDHVRESLLDEVTLRVMDFVGNAHHGVALPYNYLSDAAWHDVCRRLGFRIEQWSQDLCLYGSPADFIFGRSLHFVARLVPGATP